MWILPQRGKRSSRDGRAVAIAVVVAKGVDAIVVFGAVVVSVVVDVAVVDAADVVMFAAVALVACSCGSLYAPLNLSHDEVPGRVLMWCAASSSLPP